MDSSQEGMVTLRGTDQVLGELDMSGTADSLAKVTNIANNESASVYELRIEDRTGGMPYGSKETPAGAYGEAEGRDDDAIDGVRSDSRDEVYDGQRDERERSGARRSAEADGYDVVLHEERPVISTEVYAVERLRLSVDRETQNMTYTDTVRREVVDFDLDGDTYPDVTR